MTEREHVSAEMELMRRRRLRRAFTGADPSSSPLARGLLGSAALALVVVVGFFVGGVIAATAEQEGDEPATTSAPPPGATAPTSPVPTSAPDATPPTTVAPQPLEVVVDSRIPWTDTGVTLEPGDRVAVRAEGIVAHAVADPGSEVGPAGDLRPELADANRLVDGGPLPGPHAGLIGRIGEGPPAVIGEQAAFRVETTGQLQLGVNDEGLDNNDGEFTVTIEVTR